MSICRTFSDLFLIERSYQMEMEIRPGIFVPQALETFLVERIQWIEGGQHGPFQVSEPPGFDFHALSKLASLLANEQWGLAKEMVKNLPRPPMKMEASARLGVENNNYLRKNPFRRQRRKKMEEGGEKRTERTASSEGDSKNQDGDKEESSHLTEEDDVGFEEQLQLKVRFCFCVTIAYHQ